EPDERVWYPTGDGPYPNAGEEGIVSDGHLVAPSRPWERWYYGRYHAEFCFVELEVGYRMVGDLNSAKSADAGATGAALQSFDVETPTLVQQLPGDAYHYDYGQPLDFPFSVSRFGGAKGAEVWVSYSVPLAKLKYDDSTHQATLDRSVVIFDGQLREVARDDRRLAPPDAGKRVPDAQAIDVCRFDLEPGSYSVAISLQDSAANKTGIYKYAFAVTNYLTRAEETSDLLLGREIRADSGNTKFNKAGYRIVPQPGASFKPGQTLYLYYEIYNLKPDSARQYGAEATYYFMAQGDKQARATMPQALSAAGPTLCQATALSLAGLKEGAYVVMAQVRDRSGGKMRQLANSFRIVK
ncbi:MAG TPA: hypothetical protein VMF29_00475, partial [Candidatus Edwardsbacteria bacterium]|nr:hypothetical protein [Candidatus Edwardsbacteria bacterium]